MNYLVQMKLANPHRPAAPHEGVAFIEQFILPTLERCNQLQAEKKILAGGPISGAIALSLVMSAESAQELDSLLTSLPVWPRMETVVTPLTSFDGRMQSVRSLLEQLKAHMQNEAAASAS